MLFCLAFTALSILHFVLENWEFILTVLGFLIWAVKSTKWGKANAQGLQVIAGVVERLNHQEIKKAVKADSAGLSKAVLDAIEDAVRTVDPAKPTPTTSEVLVREVTRLKE